LPTCLASLKDIADEVIVVDTGSTDDTRDVAASLGARVFDFVWCDSFAAARNESLRHARGPWVLWLDADEFLDPPNRDKLRTLLAGLRDDDNTAFVLQQRSNSPSGAATLVGQVRLFRNLPGLRWDYRVHEQILPALRRAGQQLRFTDIALEHTGYVDAALRRRKLERNLRLLHLERNERPDDPFTLFNLGWAYADLGRTADAIPVLQHSLQRCHPGDSITAKLYTLLVQCHRRLGQHAEAWDACMAGHARCPADAELLFLKGQLCLQRGDCAAARACWLTLLPHANGKPAEACACSPSPPTPLPQGERGEEGPSPPTPLPQGERGERGELPEPDGTFASIDAGLRGRLVRNQLAVLAVGQGNDADAAFHWQTALAESPDFLPALLGLADLHLRQGHWSELEQLLDRLQGLPPAAVECLLLRGRAHLFRKEFEPARRVLEEAIRQAPQDLRPWLVLSHVLLQAGDEKGAEPLLRHILEADPTQAESWRNLAVLCRHQGRLREALAATQAGKLHCGDDGDLLLLHAVLLREGGDEVNAETCLLRLLEREVGEGPAVRRRRLAARRELALLLRSLGRLPEAVAQWRALLTEEPENRAARLGLGECWLAQERWGEVEALLGRLEQQTPEALEVLLLRGRVYLARRQFAEARRIVEKAMGVAPRSVEARVLLSYVHLQEDRDPAAAEAALRAVLELDPNHREAQRTLAVLHRRHAAGQA
jgi:tetratricopeptide (TPR) repeat protein